MKKQKLVLTSAMAATLVALPACSSDDDWDSDVIADRDTRVCVDQLGNRVDDDDCDSSRYGYRGGFSWFYIGRMSRIPYYGDSIRDKKYGYKGTFKPSPGVNYTSAPMESRMTRSAAMARGGFGSSSRAYGGGRS